MSLSVLRGAGSLGPPMATRGMPGPSLESGAIPETVLTGLLTPVSTVSGIAPDSKLGPGMPRVAIGGPNEPAPRNTDNDIWAADLHLTPNGKFLYVSERTGDTLNAFGVDGANG